MKPVFVLCEGPHDIAFWGRLLKVAGVESFKETLDHYEPAVLRKFLIGRYQNRDVEGGRFRRSGPMVLENPPVFEAAYRLPSPARLLLFHRCVGDNYTDATREFLAGLVELSKPGAADVGLASFSVLFVRDADDRGIEARVADLRSEFGEILMPVLPDFAQLEANDSTRIVRHGDFSAGCCVFAAPNKTTGTLEDIVWPLLYPRIPARLDDARAYVDKHGAVGHRGRTRPKPRGQTHESGAHHRGPDGRSRLRFVCRPARHSGIRR